VIFKASNCPMKVVNDGVDFGISDHEETEISTGDSQSRRIFVWDYSFHGKFYNRVTEKSQILEAYRRVRDKTDTNGISNIPELILVNGETVSSCSNNF
jgi:hypothetical protein